MSDRLTLNLGLRWEYKPGPTDTDQPAVAADRFVTADSGNAGDTARDSGAGAAADVEQRLQLRLQRRLDFTTPDNPHAWHSTPWNFLPRVGANYQTRATTRWYGSAYARYMMPSSDVRDTLGDFVEQYAGFPQFTNTLGLANGVPRQVLVDPFPPTSTR